MNCSMCDNSKKLKGRVLKKHKYKECGLDNVILSGVKEFSCENCGEIYLGYGDVEKLHQLIAYYLIKKDSTLTGKELRFLRKYLGFSGLAFSKLVGYEAEHLSRLENGKYAVAGVFDKLVRMLVSEKMPDRDYNFQDLFLKGEFIKTDRLEFSVSSKKGWVYKKSA